MQSGFWGSFKNAHGWRALPFTLKVGDRCFGLLVLVRRMFRFFSFAYVPFGPPLDPGVGRGELLSDLARALRPHLHGGTLFIRFDLPWEMAGEAPGSGSPGVRKAANDIQPPSTVVVDLTPPLEEILSAMKSKTRYNIRIAAKKGIVVREGSEGDLDAWYEIYRETSRRDRIAIHSKAYYADLLKASRGYAGAAPSVKLLLARAGDELLAGNIVVFWKRMAVYLTGASSGEKRNLMPTYLLQWEAIRMAKEAGCASYDLYGVPPAADPGHPMFGLYQFKTGFSQKVLRRWGTWDVPYRRAGFALYGAAEKARLFFFRTLLKRALLKSRGEGGHSHAPANG